MGAKVAEMQANPYTDTRVAARAPALPPSEAALRTASPFVFEPGVNASIQNEAGPRHLYIED